MAKNRCSSIVVLAVFSAFLFGARVSAADRDGGADPAKLIGYGAAAVGSHVGFSKLKKSYDRRESANYKAVLTENWKTDAYVKYGQEQRLARNSEAKITLLEKGRSQSAVSADELEKSLAELKKASTPGQPTTLDITLSDTRVRRLEGSADEVAAKARLLSRNFEIRKIESVGGPVAERLKAQRVFELAEKDDKAYRRALSARERIKRIGKFQGLRVAGMAALGIGSVVSATLFGKQIVFPAKVSDNSVKELAAQEGDAVLAQDHRAAAGAATN